MSREGAAKMQSYEVIFYDLEDGTEPAKEFLLSLDVKMRAKMLRTIDLLAVNGVELREPHSKPLDDGIFELFRKKITILTHAARPSCRGTRPDSVSPAQSPQAASLLFS